MIKKSNKIGKYYQIAKEKESLEPPVLEVHRKEALREKIKSEVSEDVLRYILQDKDDFSNSYSYTIQTKIY